MRGDGCFSVGVVAPARADGGGVALPDAKAAADATQSVLSSLP